MSASRIGFITKPIVGRGQVDPSAQEWSAQMLATRSVGEDEFFEAVASHTRQSAAEVQYMFSMASDVLRDFLRQGCHVNLSDIGFALALTGKFPNADAPADPSRNSVRVTVHAKPSFAKSIAISGLELENMAHPLEARIFSVMDDTLKEAGVIADASHVLITGEGLMVDGTAGDEGVWIVDADGNQVAEARILENDAASIECAFDAMPPAGSYRIEVRARNGAARSFAPATVRKQIEVK